MRVSFVSVILHYLEFVKSRNSHAPRVVHLGKIIQFHGGPCHLSAIPLKDSHLFKITELVISFYLNFFFYSAILNMWEFLVEW